MSNERAVVKMLNSRHPDQRARVDSADSGDSADSADSADEFQEAIFCAQAWCFSSMTPPKAAQTDPRHPQEFPKAPQGDPK